TFLNDVTADEDGRVFVSDMMQNQIWVLDGDQFELWLQDVELENPNGLLAEPDRLVVGAWGKPNEDFTTDVPGHLKAVDYASKEITSIGPGEPIGNLDVVEPDGQGGYLVTDWVAGGLYRISSEGKAELLMELNQGSADHEFVESEGLVVIPMMMDGTDDAYKRPQPSPSAVERRPHLVHAHGRKTARTLFVMPGSTRASAREVGAYCSVDGRVG